MSAVSPAQLATISPSPAFPPFSVRWTHLTGLFLDPAHNSPRTLVGRVAWLKNVAVAVFLCIPVVGHVLWLFPCMRFRVSAPASRVAVGSEQIPEVGLPNLGNTCWMNAVLQAVFRSPTLVERIIAIGKKADPSELIVLLNNLIAAMQAGAETYDALQDLNSYAQREGHSTSGEQNDGTDGLLRDILSAARCRIEVKREHRDRVYSPSWLSHAPSVREKPLTFVEAMLGTKADSHSREYLTKVPPVFVVRFTLPQDGSWLDQGDFPHSVDFTSVFTNEVQQHKKKVTYRLTAAGVYSGDGRSGHHTVQQIDPPNYYDDSSVSASTPAQIDARLRRSLFLVWEIEDPSLVDASYNLSAS